jgi:hypothetical protein
LTIEIMRDPTREGLRELVRQGLLTGWYAHRASDGTMRWVVAPANGRTVTYDGPGIRDYLSMAAS